MVLKARANVILYRCYRPNVQWLKRARHQNNKIWSLNRESIFALSRIYVPVALYLMYRRGVFLDSISSQEIKGCIKVAVSMHLIDVFGHFLFRLQTHQVLEKHIGINEEEFALKKKKTMDDYLIQKDYFKEKKENRGKF